MIEQLLNAVSNPFVILMLLTFLPFLELRASIPYGVIVLGMEWWVVFIFCVIINVVLGPIIYWSLHLFMRYILMIRFLDKIWKRYIEKVQKRVSPYVDKYGVLGVGLFIGVPLPGSGSYSGAIGSYVLGLKFKQFFWANVLGVVIAGIAVTLVSVLGNGAWGFLITRI